MAAVIDSDHDLDPSQPPEQGWNSAYIKWIFRRAIESLAFRAFTFTLIIVDIIVVIIDLINYQGDELQRFNAYQMIDLIITIWFVLELGLRIVCLTPPVFFSRYDI